MSIRTELELSTRGFNRNLDAATDRVRQRSREMRSATLGIGDSMAGAVRGMLPAIGVASFGAAIKGALQRADDLADLKIALNESAEALQRVDYAAQQTASMGIKDVASAIVRLERNLGDLRNTQAIEALNNLGLSASSLARMPLEEKIVALSRAFQQARQNGTGVDAMMDLIGRSGANLIPMLGQTEEALRGLFADAPVVADELIDRMAILNDQFDGLVVKAKNAGIGTIGALSEIGTFLKDLAATGSVEDAMLAFDDRQVEALQRIAEQRRAQEMQSEALATQQGSDTEASTAERAAAEVERIKAQLEQGRIDLLPDDEKLAELKRKLDELLRNTVGNFGLNFEASVEGLAALVAAREGMDGLPASGQNSVLEAMQWLAEARKLQGQIGTLESRAAAAAAPDNIDALRQQTAAGAFDLMSPAQQFQQLKNTLSASLGVSITSESDIRDGLERLNDLADDLAAEGDLAGEAEVRQQIIAAQRDYGRFRSLGSALASGDAVGEVGSVQRLVNQVMGRDPQQMIAEETRQLRVAAEGQKTVLDQILAKMDEPPPTDVFGGSMAI